jgi:putative glutamine amidotransferase
MHSVHIAIPEPTSPQHVPDSAAYNQRSLPQYLHALYSAGATPIPIPLHESPQRVAKILSTCHGILLPGSPADIDPQKYGESPNGSEPPDPARAAVDELLIQDAFNLHKPILGICQGTQALNVWCNGTLIQDIPTQVGTILGSPRIGLGPWSVVDHSPGRAVLEAHPIQITPNTRLAALRNSCHPQETYHPERTQNNDRHPERSRGPQRQVFVDGVSEAESKDLRLSFQLPEYVNSSHHQAIRIPGDNLIISAISPQDGVIEAIELDSRGPDAHFVLAVQWHPERSYDSSALSRAIFAAFVHAAEAWTPRKIEESVLHA